MDQQQQQQQPSLRLPNGSVITHFQISNNISFPVNFTIDNMTSKLIQTDASKRIQDNLTRFMVNYSNFKKMDMNGLFSFNGIMIPPIVIYTFFTRENDFSKINWQPILDRINTNNSSSSGLLQKVEHIWNVFIKPFSYWIHNDPVAKEQYRNSKTEIEKAVFEQKDKLSVKLQMSLREKYGINLPLPNQLQAKINQQMNNMKNNQHRTLSGNNNYNGSNNNSMMGSSVNTPLSSIKPTTPLNGEKPAPKKRGRKSKKEKEALLLAQQQQAMLNGTPIPEVFTPDSGVKKKKKPTKKELEKQKKLVEMEIKNQTEFIVKELAEKKQAIPKVMKPKSIRNYRPLELKMDVLENNSINFKELQIVKQLENLRPKFVPDVSQPLEQSTHTLNSLLMISLSDSVYDTNIVYGFIEDLVKMADSIIIELLENDKNIIEVKNVVEDKEELNVKFAENEANVDSAEIKVVVDALTGMEVKKENENLDESEVSKENPIKQENVIKNEDTLDSFKNSFDIISEYKKSNNDQTNTPMKCLQDVFNRNFYDLNKPIITENYLFSICEDEPYFKVLKLLTIMTIFRNLSIDKQRFLSFNYQYDSTNKSYQKNSTSFPKLFKLFNTFTSSCSNIILKHSNSIIYSQYMKAWLALTANLGEVLKVSPSEDYNFDFFTELITNLKFFISIEKHPLLEKAGFISKQKVTVGGYVADILLKMYYTTEKNSRFMDTFITRDSDLTNSIVKLLMFDVLNYESIEWAKLSFDDFDFLLPQIFQSLNFIKLIIEKKINELDNYVEKKDELEFKIKAFYANLNTWVKDYGFMNKMALLFQFSYKFFRDLPNKMKEMNKQQIRYIEERFLKNYQSFLESILTIFNLIYGALKTYPSKDIQQSILIFDCNFIRKNIILEMLLSSKFKPIQPKLMILLDNQYKIKKLQT